jgi:hypothetical protein
MTLRKLALAASAALVTTGVAAPVLAQHTAPDSTYSYRTYPSHPSRVTITDPSDGRQGGAGPMSGNPSTDQTISGVPYPNYGRLDGSANTDGRTGGAGPMSGDPRADRTLPDYRPVPRTN